MGVCQGGKIWMLTTKNQPSHRNGVSQNALLGNCMYFIFRQMTFLRQNFAENRTWGTTISCFSATVSWPLPKMPYKDVFLPPNSRMWKEEAKQEFIKLRKWRNYSGKAAKNVKLLQIQIEFYAFWCWLAPRWWATFYFFFLIILRCALLRFQLVLLAIFENRCAPLHLFSKCFFTREIISLNSDNYQSAFISDVLWFQLMFISHVHHDSFFRDKFGRKVL